MKKIVKYIIFVAISLSIPCYGAELLAPTRVNSVSGFFKLPAGTVAFLPNVNNKDGAMLSWDFLVLSRNGAYKIPRQSNCWFLVNHRDTNRSAGDVTYAAVQMVLYRPIAAKEPLYVYRNEGWYRDGDLDFSGIDELQKLVNRDPGQFFDLHAGSDLSAIDKFLNAEWHAVPEGSDDFSWDRKYYWATDFSQFETDEFRSNFSPKVPGKLKLSYQSYLLKFQVTHRSVSDRPVRFNFDCNNNDFAWIQISSPDDPDYDKQFFLTID